jgi:ribosomal protein S18 acetylase RimI-like enzyme
MKNAVPLVRPLERGDHGAWLAIAAEVEPLFGPMVDSADFRQGIQACIDGGEAYGVEDEARALAGIVALSRTSNEIVWLAVKKDKRGRGYGGLLVEKAVEVLGKDREIHVQTFASSSPEGAGARAIYRRHGFADLREAGPNPAGIPTVIMVRKPA